MGCSCRDRHRCRKLRRRIIGLLKHSYATLDGALFWRMMQALQRQDNAEFERLNDWLSASRESHELELEDRRMAESLLSLLRSLDGGGGERFSLTGHASYPAAFAIAASHWGIAPFDALRGLMWTVVESQVTAAIRRSRLATRRVSAFSLRRLTLLRLRRRRLPP